MTVLSSLRWPSVLPSGEKATDAASPLRLDAGTTPQAATSTGLSFPMTRSLPSGGGEERPFVTPLRHPPAPKFDRSAIVSRSPETERPGRRTTGAQRGGPGGIERIGNNVQTEDVVNACVGAQRGRRAERVETVRGAAERHELNDRSWIASRDSAWAVGAKAPGRRRRCVP